MRAYLLVTLAALLCLDTVAPASQNLTDTQLAASSTDRSEALVRMGPHEVGFHAATLQDPSSGRLVHVMIWYPTADPVADKPAATYPHVVAAGTSLHTLPYTITAQDFSSFIEGRLVYENVSVSPGRQPIVVHLTAAATPGFVHIYEGVKFASHGFIFVSVTQASGVACVLNEDVRVLVDELLSWDDIPGHLFHQAIDRDHIFGGGHSSGGRTWIERTSGQQECGIPTEDRLHGLVLKDALRQGLLVEQLQLNVTPTFLNLQADGDLQIDLQRNLGSRPKALALDGITPHPSAQNHRLFAQACMSYHANQMAGNPVQTFFPPQIIADCQSPAVTALQTFFAQQTSKHNIAFLQTLMGDRSFESVLAPGQAKEPGIEILMWRPPLGSNQ